MFNYTLKIFKLVSPGVSVEHDIERCELAVSRCESVVTRCVTM